MYKRFSVRPIDSPESTYRDFMIQRIWRAYKAKAGASSRESTAWANSVVFSHTDCLLYDERAHFTRPYSHLGVYASYLFVAENGHVVAACGMIPSDPVSY
jgi:hypothetical protein